MTTIPSREGYLDLARGRVWYAVHGADAPGTPLLVLHGGPGAPHDYLEPLAGLTEGIPGEKRCKEGIHKKKRTLQRAVPSPWPSSFF